VTIGFVTHGFPYVVILNQFSLARFLRYLRYIGSHDTDLIKSRDHWTPDMQFPEGGPMKLRDHWTLIRRFIYSVGGQFEPTAYLSLHGC